MLGYFTTEELNELGFAKLGANVKISKTSTLYNLDSIEIGSNVRIDNFCTIAPSGQSRLSIGSNVHISAYNFINGLSNITLENFVTTAPFVRLFSSSDDYSGETMAGGTLPKQFVGTISGEILIRKHTIIGTGASILPNVVLAEGTVIGAYSLVTKSTEPFSVYAGIPAKFMKPRKNDLLELEQKFLSEKLNQ